LLKHPLFNGVPDGAVFGLGDDLEISGFF
jgi:hypothetical protein